MFMRESVSKMNFDPFRYMQRVRSMLFSASLPVAGNYGSAQTE